MQASGGSYVGAVVGTPGAHQQQNKAKGLLVLLQAIHSCLKRWDKEFFPEEDDSFARQVKLLSRSAAQTKLDALLQLTKVLEGVPLSAPKEEYFRTRATRLQNLQNTLAADDVPMQATLRILRSLDFAIWQIKSKVLFLANACTSVTSTVRLRSLALTVLHVSSILMDYDVHVRETMEKIQNKKGRAVQKPQGYGLPAAATTTTSKPDNSDGSDDGDMQFASPTSPISPTSPVSPTSPLTREWQRTELRASAEDRKQRTLSLGLSRSLSPCTTTKQSPSDMQALREEIAEFDSASGKAGTSAPLPMPAFGTAPPPVLSAALGQLSSSASYAGDSVATADPPRRPSSPLTSSPSSPAAASRMAGRPLPVPPSQRQNGLASSQPMLAHRGVGRGRGAAGSSGGGATTYSTSAPSTSSILVPSSSSSSSSSASSSSSSTTPSPTPVSPSLVRSGTGGPPPAHRIKNRTNTGTSSAAILERINSAAAAASSPSPASFTPSRGKTPAGGGEEPVVDAVPSPLSPVSAGPGSAPSSPGIERSPLRKSKTALGNLKRSVPPPSPFIHSPQPGLRRQAHEAPAATGGSESRTVSFSVEDQANAKLVQAQLAEEDRQRAQDKEEQRAVRKDLDMSEDSMHNRRARDKRKSIFLSMSIDSRMALPDELIITKQQVVLPSANPARGNQSLLGRELRAGDNLRGIDLNELLSDGDDDDASVGGGSSLDSSASFARARDGQPQLHGGSGGAGGDDVSSLNLSEREILDRIDQLHANGDASSSGASGSTELSGYRVTEVLLMPKGSLNLAYRGLGSLSDDLFQLPMLTSLDIKANSVTVIPPEISRLVSLVSLDLSRNQVTELPVELSKLPALTQLKAHHNHLKALPKWIGEMTRLETLDLAHNRIRSLPAEIGTLTTLRELNLFKNELEGPLPLAFSQLTALTLLDLSGNGSLGPINAIVFAPLQSLVTLRLWGCLSVTAFAAPPRKNTFSSDSIPTVKVVSEEEAVEAAEGTGTPRATKGKERSSTAVRRPRVPSAISKPLLKPKEAFSKQRSMSTVDGPGTLTPRDENGPVTKLNHAFALEKVVAFMHELQEIVLAGNRLHQISGFKETFYSDGLGKLTYVNLSANYLTFLPASICQLPALTMLDVSHNKLQLLPPELARLKKLKTLLIDDNPLLSPSASVTKRGLEHIRSYFNGLLQGSIWDTYAMQQIQRASADDGGVEAIRGILISWPGRLIMSHALQFLNEHKQSLGKNGKERYVVIKLRLFLQLLSCEDPEVTGMVLERMQKFIVKRPQLVIAEKGVGPLIKVMKANLIFQRPLLEHTAACLLAELCTAMSIASRRDLYPGNGLDSSASRTPLSIDQTEELAKTLDQLEVPAQICRQAGPQFWQHFVTIARGDSRHLPTLLAFTFSGMATVHNHIPLEDIEWGEKIGGGVSAYVYQCKWQGRDVAIKKYHTQLVSKQEVLNEVAFLSVLCAREVLQCLGACVEDDNCFIVTEYFPQGSIFDILHGKNAESTRQHWDIRTASSMALDIARGLAYLHAMNVAHRDIKSQNVLIREDLSACVADLGISRIVGPRMTKAMGTPRYMAPEVIGGKLYDTSADVHSFGILYWELITGKMPYGELQNGWQVAGAVTSGKRPPLEDAWPAGIRDLLSRSWDPEPSVRPQFADVVLRLEDIMREFNL